MRFLLIVNPASGGGRSRRRLARALDDFRRHGDDVVVHLTSGPGDATLAARAAQGFDAVLAAGGDGTLHEVVAALALSPVPIGILPWGTGNVFAREMKIPRTLRGQCRVIRSGRCAAIDVGLADGHPFLLMASLGLDAYALSRMASSGGKKFWGLLAYVGAGLAAFVRYRHRDAQIALPDGTTDRGSFILISNTRIYGQLFVVHAQADPTDGLLDVFVFRHSSRWQFLGMVAQLAWHTFWHGHSRQGAPFLSRHGLYRTRTVRITSSGSHWFQADGESLPGPASVVSVANAAVSVLLPAKTVRALARRKLF